MTTSSNSFGARASLKAGGRDVQFFSLPKLQAAGFGEIARLPYTMKVLLENLLRREDGAIRHGRRHRGAGRWDPRAGAQREIAFTPARVILQDFTGVPAVVDLAAMRDGIVQLGGEPEPDQPAAARGAGHRPLGAGRPLRHAGRASSTTRGRVRAQPRALRVPALGTERVPQLPRGAAGHRHRPSGQPRVPRAASSCPTRSATASAGLSRHARRHRLAHDDDQRPRRPRLGRRRHRGRGRACSASRSRC